MAKADRKWQIAGKSQMEIRKWSKANRPAFALAVCH
jgi:hypothetical protein